jgi:hypothetical protein
VPVASDLGQPTDQMRAHDGLAHTHWALGRPDRARRHWQRALEIRTGLGVPSASDLTADALRAHLAAVAVAPRFARGRRRTTGVSGG